MTLRDAARAGNFGVLDFAPENGRGELVRLGRRPHQRSNHLTTAQRNPVLRRAALKRVQPWTGFVREGATDNPADMLKKRYFFSSRS